MLRRPAHRRLTLVPLTALLGLVAFATAGPATAAPSTADTTFMTTNAQTNLAEITLAQIASQRATSQAAKDLATMTAADHTAALQKLQALAGSLGVTLPTEPSAAQKADAAKLQSVDAAAFDLTYGQVQVAGHLKSIAGTNAEISGGGDQTVVAYAQGYLPVAQKHLDMSRTLVTEQGGNPDAVPGGTGGGAATTSGGTYALQITIGALGVLLVATGAMMMVRRRRALS